MCNSLDEFLCVLSSDRNAVYVAESICKLGVGIVSNFVSLGTTEILWVKGTILDVHFATPASEAMTSSYSTSGGAF